MRSPFRVGKHESAGDFNMSRNFDDILNDCLERVSKGEDAQQCVKRYPEHADQLFPLLQLATATTQAAHSTSYSSEAKARGLARLTQALAEGKTSKKRRAPLLFNMPFAKPILIAFVAVMITAMAAGGTTVASSNSVPGEPLYWVKTTKESISLRFFRRSDAGKSQAHVRLASVRGQEMQRLMAKGNFQEAEKLTLRIREHLNRSASYAGVVVLAGPAEMPGQVRRGPNITELKRLLERNEKLLSERLSTMLQNVPPYQRQRVRTIVGQSDLWYRVFIEALEDGGPQKRRHFFIVVPPGNNIVTPGTPSGR